MQKSSNYTANMVLLCTSVPKFYKSIAFFQTFYTKLNHTTISNLYEHLERGLLFVPSISIILPVSSSDRYLLWLTCFKLIKFCRHFVPARIWPALFRSLQTLFQATNHFMVAQLFSTTVVGKTHDASMPSIMTTPSPDHSFSFRAAASNCFRWDKSVF